MNRLRRERIFQIILGVLGFILATILIAPFLPEGIDWHETFHPAGQAVLAGGSPYDVIGFRTVPWAILPALPFAWLPENLGRAAYLLVSLAAFGVAIYRLGAGPVALGLFLISPPVLHCLLNANIDWIPMLGFILPPQIGLFLVLTKPQMGIGVAVFWLIQSFRLGGLREAVRVFAPVTLAGLGSFALYGFWIERIVEPTTYWWNASLWPLSIPVGLVLLLVAVRRSRLEYAMGAGPCLSPYVLLHSWAGALAALAKLPLEMVAAVLGLWLAVIVQLF